MADIELVIKIPEGLKKDFESEQWTALSCMEMKDALEKATPLPKGHGRLIDVNILEVGPVFDEYGNRDGYRYVTKYELDNAPTIIEADREQGEKIKEEKPYIVETETITMQKKKYNPNYGDNRMCVCGHTYYRHFDTWNDMEAVRCKYCGCEEFIEADGEQGE